MITFISQQLASRSLRSVLKGLNKLKVERTVSEFYFGYGANLSKSRFDKNQMKVELIGTATLSNYKLSFGLQSQFKNLGYASIRKEKGQVVWGQLYKIDKLSLLLLDIMEFVPFGAYKRIKLPVLCDSKSYSANVYVALREKKGLMPSPRYLKLIVASAEAHGYPKEYRDSLNATACIESIEIDHEFTILTRDKKRKFIKQLKPFYRKHDKIREQVLAFLRRFD